MSRATSVLDIMTREVETLGRNDQLSLADDLMKMKRIRHLPVLDDDGETLAGILSQRDMFRGALARALGYGETAQTRMLELLKVKEVMSGPVVTVRPETPLDEAARLMLERKIGCVVVVDGAAVVGILSEADFVAAAASKP